jgi:3-mercaptopropionate dioxygenase
MSIPSHRLERFVREFTRLVDAQGHHEADMLAAGRPLLAQLIAADDWLPEAFARAHPQYYQQYLLHADPQDRFSVVSFVWGPGQKTPVHNHTVWALIGMLRGSERGERFALRAPGEPMRALGMETLHPGDVDQVSPTIGDIHRVSNAHDDRVSISIHVYGGNIGRITRSVFDVHTGATKPFISGYSNPSLTAA